MIDGIKKKVLKRKSKKRNIYEIFNKKKRMN